MLTRRRRSRRRRRRGRRRRRRARSTASRESVRCAARSVPGVQMKCFSVFHHYLLCAYPSCPLNPSAHSARALPTPAPPKPTLLYSASKRAPISKSACSTSTASVCLSTSSLSCHPVLLDDNHSLPSPRSLFVYLFSRCSSVKEMERIGPSPLPAAPVCLSVALPCRIFLSLCEASG